MANDTDSFGEYDPTSPTNAFAPTQTPEQIAEAQRQALVRRQKELQAQAEATASANAPYQNQVRAGQSEQARQEHITRTSKAGEAGNDWLYPGIVAGTIGAGVLGAGLVGAAGAGAAAGGIAPVTAAPSLGAVGTMPASMFGATVAPAAAGTAGAAGAGAGAAGAAGALGGAAAAAPAAASWLTPATALGLGGLALDAGGIVASQIRTKAENDLIEKQKELAAAAKARQTQVQQEGMNRLGQQMLAFAPLNRAMQEMYGQGAGYSPEQMGAMVADPGAQQGFDNNNPGGPSIEEVKRRQAADLQRQAQVSGAFAPAQGPAPLQQRTPMPARRF